jgi:hypothetical protein
MRLKPPAMQQLLSNKRQLGNGSRGDLAAPNKRASCSSLNSTAVASRTAAALELGDFP